MSESDWQKVKEIFDLAINHPLDSRQEYVEKLCDSNSELLAEIRSLLEVYDESDSLIEENSLNVKSIVETREADVSGEKSESYKTKSVSPSLLKGDLDNIILKTLRKQPNRRYQSVEDLSDDISNYLNGLPVKARPNTFFYRAAKFYLRNKTASIVGLFLVLSLIGGITATTWQAISARKERDRAEKRFQEVRKLSNSLLFKISPKIERLPGSTDARQELVTQALEYLDSLSNEAQDDLSLQSELASAYEKVGDVQGNPEKANLGDLQGGRQSLEKANKIRLNLVEKKPKDADSQRLLAANFNLLGNFRWWSSDVEGAFQNYQKAFEIYQDLVSQNPENLELNLELFNVILNKIKVVSANNNYVEAIKQSEDALQKIEITEQKFPKNAELERIKANLLIGTAYNLSWQDHYDILDDYVDKSLAIYEPLAATNPNDAKLQRDLYVAYFNAGGIYIEEDLPRSRAYLEKSAKVAKEVTENDKINYQAKFDLAKIYSKMGELSVNEEKTEQAIANLYEAQKVLLELVEAEPKHEGYKFTLANNYARIAIAMEKKKDFQNSLENTQRAMSLHQFLFQADSNNVMNIRAIATDYQNLGRVYEQMKKTDKALAHYQQSVEWFDLLKQKGGLGDYDKKTLETSQKAVEKLQGK